MPKRNPYYNGPASFNFDGLRFFNPGGPETDRSLREVLRWQRQARRVKWPRQVPIQPVVPAPVVAELSATLVGHATVLIQAAGLNLLTDPVWSDRASPLSFIGSKRVTAPGIAFDDLPRIDAVLLSHNHYDHLDIASLRKLHARFSMPIITPLGNDTVIHKHIPEARVLVGNWGDHHSIGNASIALVPAQHWSSRSLSDRRMALWCGFMVRSPAGLAYFAGDTGYGSGQIFRDMHAHFGAPDLALIPIGAYEPRWFMAAQHVDPAEAVRILLDLQARQALGIHWGTFKLTDEGRDEPAMELQQALQQHGIDSQRFRAGAPGDVVTVPRL